MRPERTRSALWVRAAYLLVLLVAVPLLAWNGFVAQVNAQAGDLLMRLRGTAVSAAVSRMVLVAIDDRTAARYGPLPLSRAILARGLFKIAAAAPRVLAVDLLLVEPAPEDSELSGALQRFPRVVLSGALQAETAADPEWMMPVAALQRGAVVAHVHVAPDPDGNVRSILLEKRTSSTRCWALGLEAARLAAGGGEIIERRDAIDVGGIRIPADEDRRMIINYAGPEGAFERVSFSDVLEDRAKPSLLGDRIVFLGVTAQGGGDRLFTPVSTGIGMSGVEIHANVARTILDRAFVLQMSPAAEFAACAGIAALCVLIAARLRGATLLASLAATAAVLPAASFVALKTGRLWPLGSFFAVFTAASATAGAGEYAIVVSHLRISERKRKDYAFRVQAIAHEIKTPLTAIQGSSELIAEELVPEDRRAAMAGLIHKESKRLTQLIHTFLDVERMASGALELKKERMALDRLCEEVLDRARLYAARKNIDIRSDVPAITVEADGDLLSFAIYNLLTNAAKYSPRDTTVRLAAGETGDRVEISVADQGYGITPAEQKRIFDRFYRMKRDENSAEEGSGIGLALVREIVLQHGGEVQVESCPGGGSRFTIVLPKE